MSLRTIVTARSITDNNQQIFIQCKDVYEALNIAGKLNQIELKDHSYSQVRLRSSRPSMKQGYRWISLVKWFGA
jgi:hypothetical protein